MTGGGTLILNNLGLGGGDQLTVSHGTDGVLRIRSTNKDGGAIMRCLNIDSSDDLYLPPGARNIGFTAERYGTVVFSWRGRWLG